MNILTDPFFPVLRRDGRRELLRFAELTSDAETNPVCALASPRPDLDGALLQLAIGVVQSFMAPRRKQDWRRLLKQPPTPAQLAQVVAGLAPYFELEAEGPAFMQDLELGPGARRQKIAALLIDAPGENTIQRGLDFFNKRDTVQGLCGPCTGAALFCLQTNAPSGGAGHRTGLRGGGPLTTLLEGETLWETLMLAVLDEETGAGLEREPETDPAEILPWLAPTRTSEKGQTVTPATPGVHALQAYWGVPRRIRLEPATLCGHCDLCGAACDQCYSAYQTRAYGANYTLWQHPLTPHYGDGKGEILPVHGQPGFYGYNQWLGVLVGESETKQLEPARVIRSARTRRLGQAQRLRVFGYDMDNMKARNWIDRSMPVYSVAEAEALEGPIAQMIKAADQVGRNLKQAYVAAFFKPKREKGEHDGVRMQFWQATEEKFLGLVAQMDEHSCLEEVGPQWLQALQAQALAMFDRMIDGQQWMRTRPKQVVEARRRLVLFNQSKLLKQILGVALAGEKP